MVFIGFNNWLSDKFGTGDAGKGVITSTKISPDPSHPPLLPTTRQYALTPSSSQEHLPQKTAAFFLRLPAEIRRKILIFAFGERTMHMDLQFKRAWEPHLREQINQPHICSFRRFWPFQGTIEYRLPVEWRWVVSVCHSLPAIANSYPPGVLPCRDTCRSSRPYQFDRRFAEIPSDCHIGAMGWLLSCRQAYAEGIQILYGTNIISIPEGCKIMVNHLPSLVRPQHLAMITSLKVALMVKATSPSSFPRFLSFRGYQEDLFVDLLWEHFPNLQQLYLSLTDRYIIGQDKDLDIILDAMDGLVLDTPSLRHVEVGLPAHLLDLVVHGKDLKHEFGEAEAEELCTGDIDQAWRCLSDDRGFDLMSTDTSSYPKAPRECPRGSSGHGLGYWLFLGSG